MDLRHEHGVDHDVTHTHAHGIQCTHENSRKGEPHNWNHFAASALSAPRAPFLVFTDLYQLKCACVGVFQV